MPSLRLAVDQTSRRVIVAAGLLLVCASIVRADEAERFQPVRERIAKALTDHNIPSISVAVAKDGRIVWEQGFGWADRENRVAASEHTLYSLASISKPITATGLMVLCQRHKIDLDKPANEYLGQAKLVARVGDAAQATVRSVANHSSGLPLHYQFFYADQSFRAPARDETIRRFGNLLTAPGERFQYSNLGYGVLDYVVERQAGKPFADFMREEVFLPLGMTHTSIDVGAGLEAHQAIRYSPSGTRIPFYDFDHPGASAVYSSAHDLLRFAMFHMKDHLADQRAILSDESIDEMQKPTSPSGDGGGYGVGWGSGHNRGYRVVSHSGGMPGVSTLCSMVPSEHLAVVVLCNTGSPMPGYLTGMIYKIMLPEPPTEPKSSSADASKPPETAQGSESELTGKWKGFVTTYKGQTPLLLDIRDVRDIHVKLGDQLDTLLSGAGFRGGFLRGRFAGDLDLEEARGRPCHLQLEAKLRGDVLNGALVMHTLPDGRGTNATSHWVELKRQHAAQQDASAASPAGGSGE